MLGNLTFFRDGDCSRGGGGSECASLNGVDRIDMDDAATLVTLLHDGRRSSSLSALLPGWDMLQTDVPSRERVPQVLDHAPLVAKTFMRYGTWWSSVTE